VREVSLKFYFTLIFCPIFKFVEGLILFNLHSFETVVLFFEAIVERLSPRFTVWYLLLEFPLLLVFAEGFVGEWVVSFNFFLVSSKTEDLSAF
jgi:hypothetical protein